MRELKLSHTTHALVALALALGFVSVRLGLPAGARSAPPAGPLAGSARVIDGDTIAIGETGTWACGVAARLALSNRLASKPVTCLPRGRDKYGRTLAVCFVEGQDVNAWMVRQGYAWAFVRYSASYVKEEAAAKAEGRGIWQGPTVPAWEFRAKRWAMAQPEAPA